MFEPVNITRSYEQIVAQIESLIWDGLLKVGEKMPGERELAQQFQVSRVVVRESIRYLEARGIIEVRKGSGSYIRLIPPRTLAQSITLLLELEKTSYIDLMIVRRSLEVTSARLAAERATDQNIQSLWSCMDELSTIFSKGLNIEENYIQYGNRELELHQLIARVSLNSSLATLLSAILPMSMIGRFEIIKSIGDFGQFFRRSSIGRIHDDHSKIVEAISKHDPDAAEKYMHSHMTMSIDLYTNLEQSIKNNA